MLAYLAAQLRPDDHLPLLVELCEAAGGSLRPDSPNAVRRRSRAAARAYAAGQFRLPPGLAESIGWHVRAAECRRAAYALLDQPGAEHDGGLLHRANRLLVESRECADRAGPSLSLNIGGRQWTYGTR